MSQQYRPPRRRGPSAAAVALALLLAALAGVAVGAAIADRQPGRSPAATAPTTTPVEAPAVPLEAASVTSFDPVGGSGFRDEGDGTWSTQTYTTAEFGNLKEGVGLLVDLGAPREVTSVTLPSATPGLSVQLLAGDAPPSGGVDGLVPVGEPTTTADGPTTLTADAGAHRYWLVWVSQLAASGDGFAAEMATPVVEGRPG